MLSHFAKTCNTAETRHRYGHTFMFECMIQASQARDFLISKLLLFSRARDQRAEFARTDEQDFVGAFAESLFAIAVLREIPQCAGNLCVGKQLSAELDDTIHVAAFHQRLANFKT